MYSITRNSFIYTKLVTVIAYHTYILVDVYCTVITHVFINTCIVIFRSQLYKPLNEPCVVTPIMVLVE